MTNEARRIQHIGDDEAFIGRLHDATSAMRELRGPGNDNLLRRLQHEMPSLRGVFGHIGQALETTTRSNASGTDAPGLAGQGGDIAGGQDNGSPATTTKG